MEDIQKAAEEGRIRIDQLIVKRGLARSRERARELIRRGCVSIGGKTVMKPGETVSVESEIVLQGAEDDFVSRGGWKLQGAFEAFGLNVEGMDCLDAGASTGGFTDVLLRHGARKVFAVDVGTDQLDPKLKEDDRVISLENTNIRTMDPSLIEPCGFFCADLSFISLTLVLEPIGHLVKENALGVVLVKPQFEAGREYIGKGGIVKDPKVHIRVLEKVIRAAEEAGFVPKGLKGSPIRGGDGNIEYLLLLEKGGEKVPYGSHMGTEEIRRTVSDAWAEQKERSKRNR